MNQRQQQRRKLFQSALATMPKFETWTTDYTVANDDGDEETVTQHHVKVIPRRLRRSMALALSRRQWQAQRAAVNPAST